jgi:hypothetical protein
LKLLVTIRYKGEFQLVYNEINLGFLSLEIYTTEDGIHSARLKKEDGKHSSFIVVPNSDIYIEKVKE